MKPFVYSLAMIEGFTPCDEILHVQPRLMDENGRIWEPRNSTTERIGEKVSILWALQRSSNWITAQIMSRLSPYTLVRLLRSFGLKNQMDPVISICLGTPDVSVGEMVSGYTVFANKGIRVEPLYVTRVEDAYGNTIAAFSPQMNEVLPEDASNKMLSMLKAVVDGGSGSRLRFRYNLTAEMGGKTGTTQNNSDGWFMGFTPSLVSGVWVGGEERSIHFDRLQEGQGASMALPIYGLFMQKVFANKSLGYSEDELFDIPEGYQIPCEERPEEGGPYEDAVPDMGGIDRMFE
jgi:penicillin-binding protein 1A